MKKFINEILQVNTSSQNIESNCNSIAFINIGTEPVTINGSLSLVQYDSIALSGEAGEMDKTLYSCVFGSGGGTQKLVIIRKIYVK